MAVLRIGSVVFEWDDEKAESNLVKHGITFLEATTVFLDDGAIYRKDVAHSMVEERFLLIGRSIERKILTVVHVERGARLRIVSARRATPRERRDYVRRNTES